MDMVTLETASRQKYFKKKFKGVLFSDETRKRSISNYAIGDFFIVNTNHVKGIHWYSLVRGGDMWVIFDSSEETALSAYKNIIDRLSLPVIIDRANLQSADSLLCGEYALCSVVMMGKTFLKMGKKINHFNYPKNYYSKRIAAYVRSKNISSDKFVFNFIYKTMKHFLHITPEKKSDVEQWLSSF